MHLRWVASQPFLAVFLFAFANGFGALPALIAAHRLFAASAIAFRAVALSLCFRLAAAGAGALAALTAAQRFRAASAIAPRPAALNFLLRATGAGAGAVARGVGVLFPGGRPRRFTGPCRA